MASYPLKVILNVLNPFYHMESTLIITSSILVRQSTLLASTNKWNVSKNYLKQVIKNIIVLVLSVLSASTAC